MADNIPKRIKQLENQNIKFKKLLDATLELTNEENLKILKLQNESDYLKEIVAELEQQKLQLEEELHTFLNQGEQQQITNRIENLESENNEIRKKLDDALSEIQRESDEIDQLRNEDTHLKETLTGLESEKEQLLEEIHLIKEANEKNHELVEEHLKLRQEIASLEQNCGVQSKGSFTGQELVEKLTTLENLKTEVQRELKNSQTAELLSMPTEKVVLELKITSIEKQKENLLKELRTVLLKSAEEIGQLHCNTQDDNLRRLINEMEIHKAVLMINMVNAKESSQSSKEINVKEFLDSTYKELDEQPKTFIQSISSEIIQNVTESKNYSQSPEYSFDKLDDESHDGLPTLSEEEETLNELYVEHERLSAEMNRLENERSTLLEQLRSIHSPIAENWEMVPNGERLQMLQESSENLLPKSLDDATNQMFANEEELLGQRVRELEMANQRIKTELATILEQIQNDKAEMEILQQAEQLMKQKLEDE